ncbi:helix-turn-helix domain-containing protein [Streptomyces uncialis]|uniref:helix-turn-helix domain-containing protein n=1 Tax=Streptomyces uncialis TaxID=1048205 RepID=UPI00224DFE76|nr:helix-turn-helix transcriptional regulator [Streptomyces uncialis]MCX4661128.1 helix-turn-helix domain-containing protein [Streptomyces uncialis]
MEGNEILREKMAEAGFTQSELAEAVNADLRSAGYEGTVSDRTVRTWLTGKSRWPHRRQRAAIEAVFQCPITELGFIPRQGSDTARLAPPEDSVLRRRFISASTGMVLTAAAGGPAHSSARRVGTSDVERLQGKFAVLVASDHRYGGKLTIETQASALAGEALALQAWGTASQRVRGALYGCAASFTSSAMWAATDGRRFDAAQRHFHRAVSLAAMSGDPSIQFRIWSHAGSLYRHMARPSDALAANDVARGLSITRRDPLFASLGHARQAAIYGRFGDARAVCQALNHARDAFGRADPGERRPMWMTAVRDRAELEELALSAHLSLGDHAIAEALAHKSLALLRPHMQRDRAIVTVRLAHAQLGQEDLETAVATAMSIPNGPDQHPRVVAMLQDFGKALNIAAPSSQPARTWDQYTHESRSN